ncbi:MAG: UDP-3-O-acyl-N-acetylglucosamine deacetylase [bacterium]
MNADYYRERRTLQETAEIEGIGLHTGEESSLRLEPEEAGPGIRFIREDLDPEVEFTPEVSNVRDDERCTVLGSGDDSLHTVEHLLATLYALGISDVTVYVDGPEIPILDGSADGFVEAIESAGVTELGENRSLQRPDEPFYLREGERNIVFMPSTDVRISCTIQYDNPGIGEQYRSFSLSPEAFKQEIAPARTYGFEEEVEQLREKGLAKGGSLENALVVNEDGEFLGDDPQYEDEFVRHKILDILGDLALVNSFVVGHVNAVKTGHRENLDLTSKIYEHVSGSPQVKSKQGSDVKTPGYADIERIKQILPHRYPFLLLDRIISVNLEDHEAVGFKNVTVNEPFFQGHFPEDPVMPGVLVLEAMAQLGAGVILDLPENEGKNSYFMGVDGVKWRKAVRPGDQLLIEVEGKRIRPGSRLGIMGGKAYVDGEKAAEGEFKFALVDE